MRKAPTALVFLALAAPMLSGCNSVVGRALGFRSHTIEKQVRDGKEYAEQQLALGKQALDSGQYAAAIEAFRNARMFPEQAGEAYNGLAIAYLQLDRPDLAERFFKQAVLEFPTDKRFQANLNRFYQSAPEFAARTTREAVPELASLAPQQSGPVRIMGAAGQPSAVTAQSATGQMVRISANEVMIGSPIIPSAAPDGRRRSATAMAMTTRQPVRRLNPQYPVRVSFRMPSSQAAATGYPLRIGLAASSSPVKVTSTSSATRAIQSTNR